MERFFFNTHDCNGSTSDTDGLEFANLDEAKLEALRGARSIIADGIRCGLSIDPATTFDVTDTDGRLLHRLTLSDALVTESADQIL